MELSGHVRDVIRDISKTECEDRCLKENGFTCLSANYDHLLRECHLSDQSKATRPGDFVGRQGMDYLENQCEAGNRINNILQLHLFIFHMKEHEQYLNLLFFIAIWLHFIPLGRNILSPFLLYPSSFDWMDDEAKLSFSLPPFLLLQPPASPGAITLPPFETNI